MASNENSNQGIHHVSFANDKRRELLNYLFAEATMKGTLRRREKAMMALDVLQAHPYLAQEKVPWFFGRTLAKLRPFAILCLSETIDIGVLKKVHSLYPSAAVKAVGGTADSSTYLLHLVVEKNNLRTDIITFLLQLFPKAARYPLRGGALPISVLDKSNFTQVHLAELFVNAYPDSVKSAGRHGMPVIVEAILKRSQLARRTTKLKQNEDVIRIFVAACPEAFQGLAMRALMEVPHTHELIEILASACPSSISSRSLSDSFIGDFSMDVQETFVRHYCGTTVSVCVMDEATTKMVINAADTNPNVVSIQLRGHGINPATIAEIGRTTSLKSVTLIAEQECLSGECKKELNLALAEALRYNRSIENLTVGGNFDSTLCLGLSTDNISLKSLFFRLRNDGDDLKEVETMLKCNTTLTVLAFGGGETLSESAAMSLAKGLKENTGLLQLSFYSRNGIESNGLDALDETMLKYNTTLQNFYGNPHIWGRMEWYCALNRAGRGALLRNGCVSTYEFIKVLSASIDDLDILYGLVRFLMMSYENGFV